MALRIRTDVDLKELEKYEFNVDDENFIWKTIKCNIPRYDGLDLIIFEKKILKNVNYYVHYDYEDKSAFDTLYDLIKADLVVKVEE